MVAEQLHATAAAVHRCYPEYTVDTVMSRSLVLAANQLLPTQSEDARVVARFEQKLGKINHKSPNKVSGRQMYIKELHAAARELMSASGQPTPTNFAKLIMRAHSDAWKENKRKPAISLMRRRRREQRACRRCTTRRWRN